MREALRAASRLPFPRPWIGESLLEEPRELLFRRAVGEGLDAIPLPDRRGHLNAVCGQVAEAIAARLFDQAGFNLFSQLIEDGARGADLIFFSPNDNVLVLEVKGTLRANRIPPLGRSRLSQMSAAWLDHRNQPMVEWELEAGDVYGAIAIVDLAAATSRVAATANYATFTPLRALDEIDSIAARLHNGR